MLCDNCHERPASIHLYTNVNGQDREISLCQQCYQELKNQQGQINSMNNNNAFFGDFDDLLNALNNSNNEQNNSQERDPRMQMGGGRRGGNNGGQKSLLDQYGTDLTDLAKKGKIDPVIGRDKEIARVIEILNRRTKTIQFLLEKPALVKQPLLKD